MMMIKKLPIKVEKINICLFKIKNCRLEISIVYNFFDF